ncbi:hypothetical protein HDV05_006390 [Chytridiales sp. JEL 0842]|nr:hypothetical protein HDV05_006390 [Chytridiales sp. JEL 0842]
MVNYRLGGKPSSSTAAPRPSNLPPTGSSSSSTLPKKPRPTAHATPSLIPTPSKPPPSLPPSVSGKTRFHLRVSVPKIVWTNPPSPNRRPTPSTPLPKTTTHVRLSWWGAEETSTAFFPLSVGDRRSMASPNLQAASSGKTMVRFPIKCHKTILYSYLRDMGPLSLTVQNGTTVVGSAKIMDLTPVAGEPYSRPINGWFSILATDTREGQTPKQLGEVNVSVVLEPYDGADDDEEQDVLVAKDEDLHIEGEMTMDEVSGVEESIMEDARPGYSVASPSPRESNGSAGLLMNQHQASASTRPNSYYQPPQTSVERHQPQPEHRLATHFGAGSSSSVNATKPPAEAVPAEPIIPKERAGNSTTTNSATTTEPIQNIKSAPPTNTTQTAPTAAEELYKQIFSRALKLRQDIDTSIKNPDATFSEFQTPSIGGQVGGLVGTLPLEDDSLSGHDILLGLDEGADNLDYRTAAHAANSLMSKYNKVNKAYDEHSIGESDSYVESEANESELLEDDLIIEALNSVEGKEAMKQSQKYEKDILAFEDLHDADHGLDFLGQLKMDEEFIKQLEKEDVEPQGRRANQGSTSKDEQQFKSSTIASNPSLSLDNITALGRVHSIRIHFSKLEIKSTLFSPMTTVFAVEYNIPDLTAQDGRPFSSRILSSSLPRLASSIVSRNLNTSGTTATAATQQAANCLVPFDHQDIYPFSFDGQRIESWLEANMTVDLTANHSVTMTGAPSGNRQSVGVGNQKKRPVGRKLWEAHGNWKCKEVMVSGDFYWTGRIPVWSSDERIVKTIGNSGSAGMKSSVLGKTGPGNAVAAAAAAKEKAATKHVGDLIVTVELVTTGGVFYKQQHQAQASQIKPASGQMAARLPKSDDTTELSEAAVASKTKSDTLSVPRPITPSDNMSSRVNLPPFYYHVRITTTRGLSILSHSSKNDSTSSFSTPSATTLLYLVVRLFTASAPISTPPIPYFPPVDLTTGRLNPPPNFDYSATVPIAITPTLVENFKNSPMIVEVWMMDVGASIAIPKAKEPESPSESGDEKEKRANVTGENDGAKLLGLLKLPFHHLLTTVAAAVFPPETANPNEDSEQLGASRGASGYKSGGSSLGSLRALESANVPVMIPETEYAIVDPFTGTSKGWINAFLALGTWDQVQKVRRAGSNGADGGVSYNAEFESLTQRGRDESRRDWKRERERQKVESGFLERVEGRKSSTSRSRPKSPQKYESEGQSNYAEGSSSDGDSAVCDIQATIHAVCGVGALLDVLANKAKVNTWFLNQDRKTSKSKSKISTYTPIDYAKEVGANVFVVFRLFDYDLEKKYVLNSSNCMRLESPKRSKRDNVTSKMKTPIVAHTFAPRFDYSTHIYIRGIEGDLLRWIKKGGTATGEVWHRVPESEGGIGSQRDILLGTFVLPLTSIVERPVGINHLWVPIEPLSDENPTTTKRSTSSKDAVSAAIQLSVKFKSGFEFGEAVENGSIGISRSSPWSCNLKVSISKARIPPKTDFLDGDIDTTGAAFARWRYPVMKRNVDGNSEPVVDFAWRETRASTLGPTRSDGLHHLDFAYLDSQDLEMTNAVIKQLAEIFVVEVRRLPKGKKKASESVLVGTCHVDLWDVVHTLRKYNRKRITEPVVVTQTLPLINSESSDLKGARLSLRLEFVVNLPAATPAMNEEIPAVEVKKEQPILLSNKAQEFSKAATAPSVTFVEPPKTARESSKSPQIPMHVAIERAIQLPLVVDPLSKTISSPFVDEGETQLASPNPFVTFTWTASIGKASTSSSTTYRTQIIPHQTSPTWNYNSVVHLPRTMESLRTLKCDQGSVDFTIWHATTLKTSSGLISSALPPPAGVADVDLTSCEKLGVVSVDIAPLFLGSKEIYGWYPVMNGTSHRGQVLLKIEPGENLGAVIMELAGPPPPPILGDVSQSSIGNTSFSGGVGQLPTKSQQPYNVSGELRPSETSKGDISALVPPVAIALANGSFDESSMDNSRNSLFAAAITAAKEAKPGQNVDTWVWTGTNWDHRKVEVQALGETGAGTKDILAGLDEVLSKKDEDTGETADEVPKTSEPTIIAVRSPTPSLILLSPKQQPSKTDKPRPKTPTTTTTATIDPSAEFRRSLQQTIDNLQNLLSSTNQAASEAAMATKKPASSSDQRLPTSTIGTSTTADPLTRVTDHLKMLEETLGTLKIHSSEPQTHISEPLALSSQSVTSFSRSQSPEINVQPPLPDSKGVRSPKTGLDSFLSPPRVLSGLSSPGRTRTADDSKLKPEAPKQGTDEDHEIELLESPVGDVDTSEEEAEQKDRIKSLSVDVDDSPLTKSDLDSPRKSPTSYQQHYSHNLSPTFSPLLNTNHRDYGEKDEDEEEEDSLDSILIRKRLEAFRASFGSDARHGTSSSSLKASIAKNSHPNLEADSDDDDNSFYAPPSNQHQKSSNATGRSSSMQAMLARMRLPPRFAAAGSSTEREGTSLSHHSYEEDEEDIGEEESITTDSEFSLVLPSRRKFLVRDGEDEDRIGSGSVDSRFWEGMKSRRAVGSVEKSGGGVSRAAMVSSGGTSSFLRGKQRVVGKMGGEELDAEVQEILERSRRSRNENSFGSSLNSKSNETKKPTTTASAAPKTNDVLKRRWKDPSMLDSIEAIQETRAFLRSLSTQSPYTSSSSESCKKKEEVEEDAEVEEGGGGGGLSKAEAARVARIFRGKVMLGGSSRDDDDDDDEDE